MCLYEPWSAWALGLVEPSKYDRTVINPHCRYVVMPWRAPSFTGEPWGAVSAACGGEHSKAGVRFSLMISVSFQFTLCLNLKWKFLRKQFFFFAFFPLKPLLFIGKTRSWKFSSISEYSPKHVACTAAQGSTALNPPLLENIRGFKTQSGPKFLKSG